MFYNLLGWLVLAALTLLFGWLVLRAWQAKRAWVKWLGVALAGLVTLLLLLITVLTARGLFILYLPRNYPVSSIKVAGTPEQIARGQHVAESVCAACHSATTDLPLSGGVNLSTDTGLPLGDLYPPNLTPAGELADWTDGEILRAIREGTHKNNRVLGMPVQRLRNLSDADAQSVVAYLRSQPAVPKTTPPTNPSLLLAFFLGAGIFNINAPPFTAPVTAPPLAPTLEYGAYIVSYTDCRDCHGDNLDGKPSGPIPPGPNLRVVKGWTKEQFIQTLRTGVDPNGNQLKPPMPWRVYGRLNDIELAAVYEYLRNLPPAP